MQSCRAFPKLKLADAMSGFYIFAIVLILSTEGWTQNEDPIRIPTQTIPAPPTNSCATDQAVMDAKNDLRESISNIFTQGNYSCGGTSGWSRVAYLNMTDLSQSCPPGLTLRPQTLNNIRMCGRNQPNAGCESTFFNVNGLQYNKVCGRIRGYQAGYTSAFARGPTAHIDSYYVDGVSVTHGFAGSRTHIWTFANSQTEILQAAYIQSLCPCQTPLANQPPPFVGNDYFCESGRHSEYYNTNAFYVFPEHLWDGLGCTLSCCQREYFTKTLPARTTDNIEIRVCGRSEYVYSDSPIDQVEMYVQ